MNFFGILDSIFYRVLFLTKRERLQKAIDANDIYKSEAKIDLEFINLRSNESFIKLTE